MTAPTGSLTILAATEAPRSQPVTQLGERLAWTIGVLAVVALLALLMWRGWRNRAARQADVPPLPEVPPADALGEPLASGDGVYVSSTTAGDWLDRLVVHGLGVRSAALMTVHTGGVLWERHGAPDVFVPAGRLRAASLEQGIAGKVVERGGLVVVTWDHAGHAVDTGFRPRTSADRDALLAAVQGLLPTEGRAA